MFLIFPEMELSSHKIKTPVFQENPLGFLITIFSFVFIFLLLTFTTVFWVSSLLIAFFHIPNFLCHECFLMLFIRYFVFVLLNLECYGFERAFFTLRRFLPYTPSQHLTQPGFIKASLVAGSSSLKAARSTTEFRNIDPVDLFL